MERTNDVGDDGLGRVIDTAPLALFGVVFSQKGFIKVNDGIAAFTLMIKTLQDAACIGHGQDTRDVIHDPFELFGQITQ